MLETLSVQETHDIGATCFGRDLSAQPLSLGDRSLHSNTLKMIHYGNVECDPDGDRKGIGLLTAIVPQMLPRFVGECSELAESALTHES
jgi:hypothetical protein